MFHPSRLGFLINCRIDRVSTGSVPLVISRQLSSLCVVKAKTATTTMRHNHAVAGALVAALLAYFDIVGCAQCVAYCWPYFGLKSFLIAGIIRSKFKSATPAARAGLPRIGFAPYEFVGGDSVGLVFYPGAPSSHMSTSTPSMRPVPRSHRRGRRGGRVRPALPPRRRGSQSNGSPGTPAAPIRHHDGRLS